MATEHILKDVDIVVSKSDAAGDIKYANPIFVKLSGYTQGELLDKPHSILRHPDMPKIIFKFLWDNIETGKDVKAFVKNRSKDGGFYWVFAHVRRAGNPDGSFRNYVSTRRKMTDKAREVIEPLYSKMIEAEKDGGMEASLKVLQDFLAANGETLETFNEAMEKLNKQ